MIKVVMHGLLMKKIQINVYIMIQMIRIIFPLLFRVKRQLQILEKNMANISARDQRALTAEAPTPPGRTCLIYIMMVFCGENV